jgi:hypothetical protein
MHSDIGQISQVIIGLVAVVAAYLLHSPLGSKLDKRTTAALTFLSGNQAQVAFDKATELVSSPDARRLAAVNYLVQETRGSQLALSTGQANAALDWILKEYHEGQTLLANPSAAEAEVVQVVENAVDKAAPGIVTFDPLKARITTEEIQS